MQWDKIKIELMVSIGNSLYSMSTLSLCLLTGDALFTRIFVNHIVTHNSLLEECYRVCFMLTTSINQYCTVFAWHTTVLLHLQPYNLTNSYSADENLVSYSEKYAFMNLAISLGVRGTRVELELPWNLPWSFEFIIWDVIAHYCLFFFIKKVRSSHVLPCSQLYCAT